MAKKIEKSQLISFAVRRLDPDESETHIGLDPLLGLTDIDSHKITASNWPLMKASDSDAVISLAVSPATTIKELMPSLSEIHRQGGYQKIIVILDES